MKKKILNKIKKTDLSIQKSFLKPERKELKNLDVFLKWTPIVSLFALDVLRDNSKDKLKEHIIQFAASEIVLSMAVLPLKNIYKRTRPNGQPTSFPSAHTATSFLGSEMLRQELNDTQPLASYSGYIVAAGTAVLRLYHNKHWLSDVLTGAAMGILAATIAPRLLDVAIYKTNIQAAV